MIADVVFDVPLPHPFSYRVPESWDVRPGQRVVAPLRGALRTGLVIAQRAGAGDDLKPLARLAEPGPVLGPAGLALGEWIAAESLSSPGSTFAALLPPVTAGVALAPPAAGLAPSPATAPAPLATAPASPAVLPELLLGGGREARALERARTSPGQVLVITPDVESATAWSHRLGAIGPVARLDSGAPDAERGRAWTALAAGTARLAVGTRSALLAPLGPGATLLLADEHEAAHRPPGPPRIHAREVVLERGAREGLTVLMTSATPSVEMWWRADSGRARAAAPPAGRWPAVTVADARGILRREPLTPPLARAVREALAAGRRVFLGVSRLASALACEECGQTIRCGACAVALAHARVRARLTCAVCGATAPVPETCPTCRGRRLSPFGWGVERVEHAVRRRFPRARVARYDPDAARGERRDAQRLAAAVADVVVGTRGALRLFGPASLGLAGFVSPDQSLRLPDFRAGERTLATLWAAAERVRPDGALVIQTQHPDHYVFQAVAAQDLGRFYRTELRFRAELGYPPFRRLALLTVRGGSGADRERLARAVTAALAGGPGLVVYPATPDRAGGALRVVVKGGADLPRVLGLALADLRARRRGMMDVEVDPVEWPF